MGYFSFSMETLDFLPSVMEPSERCNWGGMGPDVDV